MHRYGNCETSNSQSHISRWFPGLRLQLRTLREMAGKRSFVLWLLQVFQIVCVCACVRVCETSNSQSDISRRFSGLRLHLRTPQEMAGKRSFVLWLHGLGDSGPANEPIKTHFTSPEFNNTRWFFPSAPNMSVTCNSELSPPLFPRPLILLGDRLSIL